MSHVYENTRYYDVTVTQQWHIRWRPVTSRPPEPWRHLEATLTEVIEDFRVRELEPVVRTPGA